MGRVKREWKEAGWEDLEEAKLNVFLYVAMRIGFTKEEALEWYASGWKDPEMAMEWKEAGWGDLPAEAHELWSVPGSAQAFEWYEAGWRDPVEALKWKKAGYKPVEALERHSDAVRIRRRLNEFVESVSYLVVLPFLFGLAMFESLVSLGKLIFAVAEGVVRKILRKPREP